MRKHFLLAITGFTLAEVLITLTIIGVIAALTIPALITNIQDAQLRVAWKKAYSDINQATSKLLMDKGGSVENICAYNDDNCLATLFVPYLSITKTCYHGVAQGNCWHNPDQFSRLNGSLVNSWANTASFILNNGSLVRFEGIGFPGCTDNSWMGTIPKCAMIAVDVNGFKGPNITGKDIFLMLLTKNSLIPMGTDGGGYENTCNTSGFGYGCSAKYLMQ